MATIRPLRQRMIEGMTIRNLSRATQQSYIYAVAKFSRHFNCPPAGLGLEQVRAYQLSLVRSSRSAWLSSTRYFTFICASSLEAQANRSMSQKSDGPGGSAPQRFTEKQGHYLAFIYVYSHMFRQAPAETDIQRHFRTSPPSVHQMIVNLHRAGLIRRKPGVPRSIELLVDPQHLPILKWLQINAS